ncbi:hypothetical protein M422DRAFT_263450 [Sphaerobolus stellatus SS14]|uniref:Uncharacterized protein n=1 Tax=Sphaerobolus stellatus (strain SS14) TaxID=990650 RepID=A0A0C9TVX6_SPHS4|nr:hypothetical protein M422DRAFT_263450 [Sphaerobolus stellatus SS14]
MPPSALAHVHRLVIIPPDGFHVVRRPAEQVVKDINAILCANVSGIQHFSLQTYPECLFAPLPNSLSHLHTFHGSIYTFQYLHTSPTPPPIFTLLLVLPIWLSIASPEVSQQFLELINITFTNVETFGFHAIRDQISPLSSIVSTRSQDLKG